MNKKKINKLEYSVLLKYWNYIDIIDKEFEDTDEEAPKVSNSHDKLTYGTDTACIFDTDEEVVIAFNGSDTVEEWGGNFKFSPRGGFHKNFYNTAKGFFDIIISKLDNDKKITVAGHSRGGLCQIVAYLLIKEGYDVRAVTFGSPRVATYRGCRKLRRKGLVHHRVSAGIDIVDNLPFKFFFFKHYQAVHYKLKTVKGAIDHLAFRKALEKECE